MEQINLFTGKANDYVKGRPSYARDLMQFLAKSYISKDSIVADIGAGTGKFTKQLLELGCYVYGVEPNDDMRKVAETSLNNCSKFYSVKGTASDSNLPSASVDFVTAAQAFHWFDTKNFWKECMRILKPNGKVFLIWNVRDMDAIINKELFSLNQKFCPNFKGFSGGIHSDTSKIENFFNNKYEKKIFPNPLFFTEETFISRSMSSSYALTKIDSNYEEYKQALRHLYLTYEKDNCIVIPNYTVLYFSQK